jgi:hypothetical protein
MKFTVHNSVTAIGNYAFACCRSLTSVAIPNSVTTLDFWVFGGCHSLADVYVGRATPLSISRSIFGGMGEEVNVASCTLHVPPGTEALYKAAAVWQDFHIVTQDVVIEPVPSTDGEPNCLILRIGDRLSGHCQDSLYDRRNRH